jgi:hypothetical protein
LGYLKTLPDDSESTSNKKLIILCYPLDWHLALSFEFLINQPNYSRDYEILDLSFIGEFGLRKILRAITGGTKLRKMIIKNLKNDDIKIYRLKYKFIHRLGNQKKLLKASNSSIVDTDIAAEAFNTIVEKAQTLKVDIKSNLKIISSEIYARDEMKIALSKLNPRNYSQIFTVNGRFTKNATVVTWAKKNKIKLNLIEFGSSKTKFEVFGDTPVSISTFEEKVSSFWENSDPKSRETLAHNFLNELIQKKGASDLNWRKFMKSGEVPYIGNKKICTYYTSTEAEYVGVGDPIPDGNFKNQVEAFRALVNILDQREWHIYLRMHPNNPDTNSQGAEAFLWEEFKSNDHITIVKSDSSIDSLALGEKSNLIATYGSTIAMELVSRGIQNVITLGPALWNNLLPQHFLPNTSQLKNYILSNTPTIKVSQIYPWAYFINNFGTEFKSIRFIEEKSRWSF